MPKIFILGATGYIGGDALYAINEAHPDWEITCLVRNSDKGAVIAAEYPKIRLVYGDLSSNEVIEKQAGVSDVVLNMASADSVEGAHACCIGLQAHFPRNGYYVHTSGTGILTYPDLAASTFGDPSDKIWDDVSNISDLISIPKDAPHRPVDDVVLTYSKGSVKTAIVCPPCIYGKGRGPGNTRSIQVPQLLKCFMERKQGFQVGEGQAKWCFVHVSDLSKVYVRLAEEALENGGAASWNDEGYYFAENGEKAWGDVSRSLAKYLYKQSHLPTADIDSLGADEVGKLNSWGPALWGANSRCRATRAREVLGWKPTGPSVEESFQELVDEEIVKMKKEGVIKGHAAVAAGE